MVCRDVGEIQHALASQSVHMHARIKTRWIGVDENGNDKQAIVETTPGRMILAEILPRHPTTGISLVNKVLTKKEIGNLIDIVSRTCGQKETVIFADRLMKTGFTRSEERRVGTECVSKC